MSGTTMIIMVTMALGMFMSSSVASGIVVWKDPFDFFDNETDPPIVSAPIVETPPAGSYTANQNCRKAKDAECGSLSGKEREVCVKRVRTDCVKAGGLWNEEDIKKYEDEQAKLESDNTISQFSTTSFNKDDFKLELFDNENSKYTCYPPYEVPSNKHVCAPHYEWFNSAKAGKYFAVMHAVNDKGSKDGEVTTNTFSSGNVDRRDGWTRFDRGILKKTPGEACDDYASNDCQNFLGTDKHALCKSTMLERCKQKARLELI